MLLNKGKTNKMKHNLFEVLPEEAERLRWDSLYLCPILSFLLAIFSLLGVMPSNDRDCRSKVLALSRLSNTITSQSNCKKSAMSDLSTFSSKSSYGTFPKEVAAPSVEIASTGVMNVFLRELVRMTKSPVPEQASMREWLCAWYPAEVNWQVMDVISFVVICTLCIVDNADFLIPFVAFYVVNKAANHLESEGYSMSDLSFLASYVAFEEVLNFGFGVMPIIFFEGLGVFYFMCAQGLEFHMHVAATIEFAKTRFLTSLVHLLIQSGYGYFGVFWFPVSIGFHFWWNTHVHGYAQLSALNPMAPAFVPSSVCESESLIPAALLADDADLGAGLPYYDRGVTWGSPEWYDNHFVTSRERPRPLIPMRIYEVRPFVEGMKKWEMLAQIRQYSPSFDLCAQLIGCGYPRDWVDELLVVPPAPSHRHNVEVGAQDRRGDLLGPVRNVTPKYNNQFWRLNADPKTPRVCKPLEYDRKSFKAWVLGEVAVLQRNFTHKTQYVTGNEACKALFFSTSLKASKRETERMLVLATVFVADYTVRNSVIPRVLTLESGGRIDKVIRLRSLRIDTTVFVDTAGWMQTEQVLVRHKPLFRAGLAYLGGDPIIDKERLQAQLDKVFLGKGETVVVEHQGAVPAFQVVVSNVPVKEEYIFPFSEVDDVHWTQAFETRDDVWRDIERLEAGHQKFCSECTILVEYQGQTQSQPWKIAHEHSLSLPGVSADTNLVEAVTEIAGTVGRPYIRLTVQIGSFLTAVYAAENWTSLLAAIAQFCSGNEAVWEMIKNKFGFLNGSQVTVPQGAGDWLNSLYHSARDLWNTLADTLITSTVVVFLQGMMSDMSEMMRSVLRDLVGSTRVAMFRKCGTDIAVVVMSSVQEIFTRIKSAFQTGSFAPLWGITWDPERWVDEVSSIMSYHVLLSCVPGIVPDSERRLKELRDAGRIPIYFTTPMEPKPFFDLNVQLRERGTMLISHFKDKPNVAGPLRVVWNRFNGFVDSLSTLLCQSESRVRPWCIVMYGLPGKGKTNMRQDGMRAVSRKKGYDPNSSGVYEWENDVNFMTNLDHTKWAVSMDDPDQSIAPPAAGVRNHIQWMNLLINNSPFQVEQAGIDLKGKIRANPILVWVTTNFTDCRVTEYSKEPLAWWRRVDCYVEVELKPEFSKGGAVLDEDKAVAAQSHDMWDLKVSKFDPSRPYTKQAGERPITAPITMTYPEFMKFQNDELDKHLAREKTRMLQRVTVGEFCPECGLSAEKYCGHTVVQEGRCTFFTDRAQSVADSFLLGVGGFAPVEYMVGPIKRRIAKGLQEYAVHIVASSVGFVAGIGMGIGLLKLIQLQYQGRVANAVSGLIPKNWVRAEQAFSPGIVPLTPASFTKDDLLASVKDSMVKVSSARYVMNAAIVSQNVIATATHLLWDNCTFGEPILMNIEVPHKTFSIICSQQNCVILPSNPEIVLIRCGELKGCTGILRKTWLAADESIVSMDEVEIWTTEMLYSTTSNRLANFAGRKAVTTDAPTRPGDCGALYLGRHNSSWYVIAMHFAATTTDTLFTHRKESNGAILGRIELEACMKRLTTLPVVTAPVQETITTQLEGLAFGQFAPYSEVWAAMSNGAELYPFGQIFPPLAGGKMKSKIKPSIIQEEVRSEFEEEWCGKEEYWKIPSFRGHMEGEVWKSPYTHALSDLNLAQPDPFHMKLALADYLFGMDQLDFEGYAELSEEQVFRGVSGSYINPVNMKTSVGPPFMRNKRNFIARDEDNSIFMDDRLWQIVDKIEKMVASGEVPRAACVWTQKDEVIASHKIPRIFCNHSFALNFVAKKKGAAWKAFVQANSAFFECMVGINMTSADCNKLVLRMKAITEALDSIREVDGVHMDKSWSGEHWDFVALLIYAISWLIGVDPHGNYCLALGYKHSLHVVKNDVFSVFVNPSGGDWTVQLNSFLMSIGERYVYYRSHPEHVTSQLRADVESWFLTFFENPVPHFGGLVFRIYNSLSTYGDDSINGVLDQPTDYEDVWLEFGLQVTDGSKAKKVFLKKITEASFLKRTFKWNDEIQMFLPPLAKKSLCRTLLFKRDTQLTEVDSAAVSLTEVLRELVYHGPEDYARVRAFAVRMAVKYGFVKNPYFRFPTYEEVWKLVREGSFQTWIPVEPPALSQIDVVQRQGLSFKKTYTYENIKHSNCKSGQ